ncbi:MAG TPA: PP0621 family protein [Gallionella sp.]|nr:PP0621 family protein [Gallionella sp.]
MSRLLLLVVIAAAIYLLLRSYRRKSEAPEKEAVTEDMVRCAYCGVHLPRSEGVQSGGKFYCCMEHRDAAHD